ncbi:MAG: thioesterase family protein [Bacteroidales bacterium]|nr:thioesterase family protein [Bacteroidales bacterium]
MEIKINLGIKGKAEQIVSYEDTAAKLGSGLVEVFATPAMVAMMENTCMNSVLPYLPTGFGTVGTKINITHTKASPVGMRVFCKSELIEIDRKRLVFEVIAKDEIGEIGRGKHERFIIDIEKFMNKIHTV